MTNKEILEKSISKALKNKFIPLDRYFDYAHYVDIKYYKDEYYEMIFSHNFAKAFWGIQEHIFCGSQCSDEYECKYCRTILNYDTDYCWQYHLQQMVLREEPLKYLEKFL